MMHTEQLQVKNLPSEDTWKDIVRIPNKHRKDHKNKHVNRGIVCCLSVDEKSKWVVVHGLDTDESVIRMDLNVRLALKLRQDRTYEFRLKKLPWWKAIWFPWRASDPIYRLPGQLGLIALVLGIVLGLIGIVVPIYQEGHRQPFGLDHSVVAPTPKAPK
jgi:hypothetical protein